VCASCPVVSSYRSAFAFRVTKFKTRDSPYHKPVSQYKYNTALRPLRTVLLEAWNSLGCSIVFLLCVTGSFSKALSWPSPGETYRNHEKYLAWTAGRRAVHSKRRPYEYHTGGPLTRPWRCVYMLKGGGAVESPH
jgi:hypothetical protein